ncbi:MAG: corrinoid protein [Candidatus Bipolaricaulota bacterium]
MTVLKEIGESVLAYQPKKAEEHTQRALDNGKTAAEVLNEGLIPAMDIVGKKYEAGEIYVPEMLMAAKAMKAALAILRPILAKAGVESKGTVVIGTVEGDLHDIGQNLVSIMLEGAGYDVVNLGIDNAKDVFVDAVESSGADVVAMSALLTTTMIQMPEVIGALIAVGLRDRVKIIVGGAPVTEEYANQIGADGYAKDAAAAVTLVRKLLG